MDESITEVKAVEILEKKKIGRPKGIRNKQVRKDKGVLRGPRKPKRVIEATPKPDIAYFEGESHAIDKQA
jgi:hypothetical protein